MKPNSDAIVLKLQSEAVLLGDDNYLSEMTDRLQKLRSLMGEQEVRKGRHKRWKKPSHKRRFG